MNKGENIEIFSRKSKKLCDNLYICHKDTWKGTLRYDIFKQNH